MDDFEEEKTGPLLDDDDHMQLLDDQESVFFSFLFFSFLFFSFFLFILFI